MTRKTGPFQGPDAAKTAREYPPKNCMIGLESITVPPGIVQESRAYPQVKFTALRLVLDRRYPTLKVVDLKVGHTSMLMGAGPFPVDVFQRPERLDELIAKLEAAAGDDVVGAQLDELLWALEDFRGNLGKVSTTQPGMTLGLSLLNVGPEAVKFEGAAFFGDVGP